MGLFLSGVLVGLVVSGVLAVSFAKLRGLISKA